MVRLRIRCRCIALAVILSQIVLGVWFFSQPLDPPKQFLRRLFHEGGQSIFHLSDQQMSYYYTFFGKELCVREGTVIEKSSEGDCVCLEGWKGRRCGVPDVIQKSEWMHNPELTKNLQLRKRARRVILVTPFSYEFSIFEANVNELDGLIDAYVIGEVNSTVTGSRKALPILDKLKNQWLKEYQDRIIYVPIAESDLEKSSFMQNLVHTGLRLISDIRPDDLFILTNGEEILSRNIILFLKLFQGYPLPVKCQYKQYLYGFYWQVDQNSNNTEPQMCASSFHFLANAFEYQLSRLQEGTVLEEDLNFFTTHEQPVSEWTIPEAGWRCHLCLSVQKIFLKLLQYPRNFKPQWLTDSSHSMLPFIQRLVKFGQDENLSPVGKQNSPELNDLPSYVWTHKENFIHLLKNPYEIVSIQNLV